MVRLIVSGKLGDIMYCTLFVDRDGERMEMSLFRQLCEQNNYNCIKVTNAASDIGYFPVESYIDLQTMINLEYPAKVTL